MVGILVHGDNHFIVRGRLPDRDVARALIRHWSIIQIGATTPPSLEKWRISTKEFREDLSLPARSNRFFSVLLIRTPRWWRIGSMHFHLEKVLGI